MIRDIRQGAKFEIIAQRGALIRGFFKWKKALFPPKKDASGMTSTPQYQLTQMEEEMVKGF